MDWAVIRANCSTAGTDGKVATYIGAGADSRVRSGMVLCGPATVAVGDSVNTFSIQSMFQLADAGHVQPG